MDLLQTLIPHPSYFVILPDNNDKVHIQEYVNVTVDFKRGGTYIDGIKQDIFSPMITYAVMVDDENREKLKYIYKDCYTDAWLTVHNRPARICISKKKYIYRVDVAAKPSMRYGRHGGISAIGDNIKVVLKLENTGISLFDDADAAYEKYEKVMSRFELMDL